MILPLPEIRIFSGHTIDIQDFMIMCPGASTFTEALDWTAEIQRAARSLLNEASIPAVSDNENFPAPQFQANEQALDMLLQAIERAGRRPGTEVAIALDIEASRFGGGGRYHLMREDRDRDTSAMIDLLLGWMKRYPILSIEDPLAEDDIDGLRELAAKVGNGIQITGDRLLPTDAERVHRIAALGAANTLLVRPDRRSTLSETKKAFDAARIAGFNTILSGGTSETEDVTIAHLAVGWNAGQMKMGSFSGSEHLAKWNEALRIEQALAGKGRFAGRAALRS